LIAPIRRTIRMRGDVAMVLFRRELGPVERFERALGDELAARRKLAGLLSIAEAALEQKRAAIERLAAAGAAAIQLDRAETRMRAVEGRARKLRAAVAECDQQIASTDLQQGDGFRKCVRHAPMRNCASEMRYLAQARNRYSCRGYGFPDAQLRIRARARARPGMTAVVRALPA
jgi:hypothetical protein